MIESVSGSTKVLGIIGWPVAHSRSPAMHNAALTALNLDYVYVPFPVQPEHIQQAVAGLFTLGVAGFSVTIPHKTAIIPYLDRITTTAAGIGAVNTVTREGDCFVGDNTDGIGFMKALSTELSFSPKGRNVMIFGAGGAARSAVEGLCAGGAESIVLVNRSAERGRSLISWFQYRYAAVTFHLFAPREPGVADFLRGIDLFVNTSSLGMANEQLPGIDLGLMKEGAVVYDMIYAPRETPLLAEARRLSKSCANGLGMLAFQGEAAFSLWTGRVAPADVMLRSISGESA